MKSPQNFIVKPTKGKRYDNTKNIGGIDFIVSTSEEDHKFSNRQAIVIETPIGYNGPIKEGDILVVHHNVFKFYNDMYGKRRSGRSHLKDDLFLVDPDQFFMYHNGTQWIAYDRYCFVEPVAAEDTYIYKPFSEEPLVGTMKYVNEYLKSQGVEAGDRISFTPESEYEFNIDGEKLYRIYDHQITMKL